MKLFISGNSCELDINNYDVVDEMDDASVVLIVPGEIDTLYYLFNAIHNNKKVILYNKDFFFTPIIKKLFQMYEEGYIDKVPSQYLDIESDIKEIIKKLEDK